MVFPSVTQTHSQHQTHSVSPPLGPDTKLTSSSTSSSVMAAPPTTKPLHNFSLPDLKWSNHHTQHRKLSSSSSSAAAKVKVPPSDGDAKPSKSEKKSKLCIKIRTKESGSKSNDGGNGDVVAVGDRSSAPPPDDAEEVVAKTWNLRPRRAVTKKPPNNNNTTNNNNNNVAQDTKEAKDSKVGQVRVRVGSDAKLVDEEKEKKRAKFSISLSREEIEEDFFALTGSKPSRRPKKRDRRVQKQLDNVFPGLWLASITPESYRVSDAHHKG